MREKRGRDRIECEVSRATCGGCEDSTYDAPVPVEVIIIHMSWQQLLIPSDDCYQTVAWHGDDTSSQMRKYKEKAPNTECGGGEEFVFS